MLWNNNDVMEGVIFSFFNATFLFFLYETEAFVEYAKLLKLRKLFEIDKYEKYLDLVGGGSYWEYLTYEKPSFLRKLISCPLCFSFWLNLGAVWYHGSLFIFIINLWATLFLYLVLRVLLKRSA